MGRTSEIYITLALVSGSSWKLSEMNFRGKCSEMRVVLFEQSFKDETTPNIAVYSFITYYEILLYFSFSPQFIQIMNNISKSYTIDSCDMLA